MNGIDRRSFRQAAQNALSASAYDPKKLILIHTGIVALVSLLASIVVYVIDLQIDGAVGLSGLGTRSVLLTVQSIAQMLPTLLIPFWAMGYTFATVKLAQGQKTGPADLCEGLYRLFPVLRLELLMALMYMLLLFAATQLGGTVFLWTPWATPVMNAAMAYVGDPQNIALEEALFAATAQASLPILLIVGGVFLILAAPFFYRFRMARLHLMANPGMGAVAAMRESAAMTRMYRMDLFRLDLGFWWFYLLEGAVAVVCNADALLALAGVNLPIPAAVRYFGFLVLSLGGQLLLHWWRKNEVYVTYAQVYLSLRQPEQGEEV